MGGEILWQQVGGNYPPKITLRDLLCKLPHVSSLKRESLLPDNDHGAHPTACTDRGFPKSTKRLDYGRSRTQSLPSASGTIFLGGILRGYTGRISLA
ncbi:hypothetical protein HQ45_07010 [Porphyromonas crevioricanis]|uniref:Uncharacterized protein n=1 Tax=Porphyromonas crevioricanis TaxID=393921 RepID=A0AB34PGS7_9PORP|nr:hypothetical protein HQ45_07010 [Porphyromonas crevioricanis]KGN93740.1 hypothetical protein HQ38_08135 [Porphyromonas crevioricanis]